MLKLKLQYFGHLMRRTDSLEKILMLGALNMQANLENSAVATGLEKVSFIPIPKKGNAKNAQTTAQLHSSHRLAMAPHSSTLTCEIPWMEEPGRL